MLDFRTDQANSIVVFCRLLITAVGNRIDVVAELNEKEFAEVKKFLKQHNIRNDADNTFTFKPENTN